MQRDIRVQRFFVGVIYPGEAFEFAGPGLLVEALGVALLADD